MDSKICDGCGREIPDENGSYCPDCKGKNLRNKNNSRRYAIAAAAFLLLAGSVFWYGVQNAWDFSWDALLGRPAAVINGEPLSWSEARERFGVARVMLEKQYGGDLFLGERGKALLMDMKRNVLDRMIEERLVVQEARRIKITIGEERVREELEKIAGEIYGNWENFQASLKEDGVSQEYMTDHVRNLLLRQELKKAIAGAQADPDAYFNAWLLQDRRNAKIAFSKSVAALRASSRGQAACCGSGQGGCGGKQASAGPLDPELKSKAGAAGLEAYRKANPGEKGVRAEVIDFGCHIQVDIEKEGKVVWSYIYQDGSVIDNS